MNLNNDSLNLKVLEDAVIFMAQSISNHIPSCRGEMDGIVSQLTNRDQTLIARMCNANTFAEYLPSQFVSTTELIDVLTMLEKHTNDHLPFIDKNGKETIFDLTSFINRWADNTVGYIQNKQYLVKTYGDYRAPEVANLMSIGGEFNQYTCKYDPKVTPIVRSNLLSWVKSIVGEIGEPVSAHSILTNSPYEKNKLFTLLELMQSYIKRHGEMTTLWVESCLPGQPGLQRAHRIEFTVKYDLESNSFSVKIKTDGEDRLSFTVTETGVSISHLSLDKSKFNDKSRMSMRDQWLHMGDHLTISELMALTDYVNTLHRFFALAEREGFDDSELIHVSLFDTSVEYKSSITTM